MILDARACLEAALEVARVMAKEKGKDETWEKNQVKRYLNQTKTYPVSSYSFNHNLFQTREEFLSPG